MSMYVAGEWRGAAREEEVRNPYDGEVVGVVPVAGVDDAKLAIAAAVEGARAMRRLSGFERSEILRRAADATEREAEALARIIALEVGKPLAEARGEADRIPALLRTSAAEGAACTARPSPSTPPQTVPARSRSRSASLRCGGRHHAPSTTRRCS
jgi:acyl-CoA reductase-like NAD-dependent aldehyde dehydrogenase